MLTVEQVRTLPKVVLHDHLDGGLRPQTVIDGCLENNHEPPTRDADALAEWMYEHANSGSLVNYLTTFEPCIAALQTRDQLVRAAREFVLDQHGDGVVYAEARWAPEQHLRAGLTMTDAVEAVRDGLAAGMAEVAAMGGRIVCQQIVCSMRHGDPTLAVAELAIAHRDEGVCGFDIAGAEDGFPPSRLSSAFDLLKRENASFTIHAGEACGLPSIWEAVQVCGANRLGHGVRIVEDIEIQDGSARLGRLAGYVRDARIALEVAPSSNLQTGIAAEMKDHPVELLKDLGFNVTINCDNRLMSATTMTREYERLVETFNWDLDDIELTTINAMRAAFLPHDQRESIVREVIRPAYDAARAL